MHELAPRFALSALDVLQRHVSSRAKLNCESVVNGGFGLVLSPSSFSLNFATTIMLSLHLLDHSLLMILCISLIEAHQRLRC